MLKRSTKVRLSEILSVDKEEMKEETRAALYKDMQFVFGEYFELGDKMDLDIKRTRSGLEVNVNFHARRVKNFTLLK